MKQINTRINEDVLEIIDSFIMEKKNTVGSNVVRNTLINDAIYKLIDMSIIPQYDNNTDFVNFDRHSYDFVNYIKTSKLISELVANGAEMVVSRFKKENYLTNKGLHYSALLAVPGLIKTTTDEEFYIEKYTLKLCLSQIIDLDGDIEGPKNMILIKALEMLMGESQNRDDEFYYFKKMLQP